MKKFLAPIIIVLAVAGMVGVGVILSKTSEEEPVVLLENKITEADNRKGNSSASIELIEYGDMQCSACASINPWMVKLLTDHGDKINFAYRHFPLTSIHKNAISGAQAVEAAGMQGKFWEMSDTLFSRQSEWSTALDPFAQYLKYAEGLSLNTEQFTRDYNSDSVKTKINSQNETAISLGLNSTPSFFLNGELIKAPGNYDQFEALILGSKTNE